MATYKERYLAGEIDFEEAKRRVVNTGRPQKRAIDTSVGVWKNKWVAFFLCLFFGIFGAHKFYEGKIGMGILYLFTFGLFGIGWFIDCIVLLFKPNPYFVH